MQKNYCLPHMTLGPLGVLAGLRWCAISERYFANDPLCEDSQRMGSRPIEVDPQEQFDSVRLVPVQSNIVKTLPLISRKRCRAQSIECGICLRSSAGAHADPRCRFLQLPCRHSFHMYCVERWLSKHSGSCPSCRTPVDTSMATAARSSHVSYY